MAKTSIFFFLYSLETKQVQENTSTLKTELDQENLNLQTQNKSYTHFTSSQNILHACLTYFVYFMFT